MFTPTITKPECPTAQPISNLKSLSEPGLASRTADPSGDSMAQTHYSTKRKRRPKNKNRKDYTQATMAAMRQHAEKDPASNKNAKKAAS